MSGQNTTRQKPAAYEVKDASGRLVAAHHRIGDGDEKRVWWTMPDGSKGLQGMPLAELPLYGSEHVADWHEDDLIVFAEGEKARDALAAAGLLALGTVTGAGSTPGPEALEVLRDRRVCLWSDGDEAGEEHMQRIAEALHGVALEVLWFTWHEAPENVKGADAADHPAVKSRNPQAIDRLLTDLEDAPRWTPPKRQAEQVGRLLSDVEAEKTDWVWRGRIPKGKLSIWEGDPGIGKSAATTDVAARVSVGRPWPDGAPCETGGVVVLSAEDGLADTIRPRLDAAGGDPSRVLALTTVPSQDTEGERLLSIPEDLPIIRCGIERVDARLVIVDPLMAFLSGDVNSHRDQDVRRALAPLAALAEDTGAAVLVVRHKATGGNALYRGGGSIGIIGAARCALLIAKHPEDENCRVLASQKSNLGPLAPSLTFTLTEAANGAVRVEWKGETSLTATALLSAPLDPEERSALDEATEFLRDALGRGPVWSQAIEKEAREASISKGTLKRAKAVLRVRSKKEADGCWSWQLPESKGIKGGQALEDDHLDPLEPLPTNKSLSRGQEDQGDQEAQEDQVRGDERLVPDGNGHHPSEHCIHDVLGGCWLCKRKHAHEEAQSGRLELEF